MCFYWFSIGISDMNSSVCVCTNIIIKDPGSDINQWPSSSSNMQGLGSLNN